MCFLSKNYLSFFPKILFFKVSTRHLSQKRSKKPKPELSKKRSKTKTKNARWVSANGATSNSCKPKSLKIGTLQPGIGTHVGYYTLKTSFKKSELHREFPFHLGFPRTLKAFCCKRSLYLETIPFSIIS